MKKFNSGEELAKEMGIKPEVLKKTCELGNLLTLSELISFSRRAQPVLQEPRHRPLWQEGEMSVASLELDLTAVSSSPEATSK